MDIGRMVICSFANISFIWKNTVMIPIPCACCEIIIQPYPMLEVSCETLKVSPAIQCQVERGSLPMETDPGEENL